MAGTHFRMELNAAQKECIMSRLALPERIWYESPVPVFIEKVLLPFGAGTLGYVIWTNPMNFDWVQRASLGSAVLLFLFFCAYSLHRRNEAIRTVNPTPPVAGTVTVTGDCNASNTGDGRKVSANCGDQSKRGQK